MKNIDGSPAPMRRMTITSGYSYLLNDKLSKLSDHWVRKAYEEGGDARRDRPCDLDILFKIIIQDHEKAVQRDVYFALDGDVEAQYRLAIMYKNGLGVDVDHDKANHWLIQASLNGNAEAQESLAIIYKNELGDYDKANHWFRRSTINRDRLEFERMMW